MSGAQLGAWRDRYMYMYVNTMIMSFVVILNASSGDNNHMKLE